jgi:archaetidylinositol phosphate synthase
MVIGNFSELAYLWERCSSRRDEPTVARRLAVMIESMNPGPQIPTSVSPPRTHAHAVARWCIRPLLNTWVTPNHLTTLRLITGCAAAALFAAGDYLWICWGGALFVISAVLDRADGELARLGGRTSPRGHWYDLSSDMVVNAVTFMGIGFGLADRVPGLWAPMMGLVSGLSVGAIFVVVFRLHSGGSHPSIAFRYPDGFDFDDTLFAIALFAWFDALLPLLIAGAIGAPLFLIYALWSYRSVRRGSGI